MDRENKYVYSLNHISKKNTYILKKENCRNLGVEAYQILVKEYREIENLGVDVILLDQEIADLKEQLHKKNQELLACTKRIADADQKIQQVRVKYMPQFQPIEEKNKGLAVKAKEIETMKSQYDTAASRVEMVKKSAEEDKKQKKEIVDTRKDELDVISYLADALKNYDKKITDNFQALMTKQATV